MTELPRDPNREYPEQRVNEEVLPYEDGVQPLNPDDPAGMCKTYDGSINIDASKEIPRNRAVGNMGPEKDKKMSLQMADASLRSLIYSYEQEVLMGRCVFSSDAETQKDLPRTCSRGYYNGTPIAEECRRCKNFTLGPEIIEIEDLWPDTRYTRMLADKRRQYYPESRHPNDTTKAGWTVDTSKNQQVMEKYRTQPGTKKTGCSKCQQGRQPKLPQTTGFGSTLEKVFSLFGVKSCENCKRRRDWLNKVLPYGKNRHTKGNKHH